MKAPSFAAHEPRDLGIRHHISLIGVTWTVCEIWIELGRGVGAYAWRWFCLGPRVADGLRDLATYKIVDAK